MEGSARAGRLVSSVRSWSVRGGWPARAMPGLLVLSTASVITLGVVVSDMRIPYLAWDSRAYYDALRSQAPYASAAVGVIGSYLYPPPFLQVLAPAGLLPWPVFAFAWAAMLTGVAVDMLRRIPPSHHALKLPLAVLAALDIGAGNINLLLAYGAVLGLRAPTAWAGVALTKVTPGIGMLWLAFRGRWQAFGWAIALTATAAAVSYLLAPDLWAAWFAVIRQENPAGGYATSLPVPLYLRVPAAIVLVWWAARTDRAWLVPIACLLALPVIWVNGLSMLLGAATLLAREPARPGRRGRRARRSYHPAAV